MLSLYRRHLKKCPQRPKGRAWKKCHCPVWADGILDGKDFRASMKTANWEIAAERLLELEAGKSEQKVSVHTATTLYLKHIEAHNLTKDVRWRYKQLIDELRRFALVKGITGLHQLDTLALRDWQAELTVGPTTQAKRIERVRTFFRYCVENGWLDRNPASALKLPKHKQNPTVPFTDEEWKKILAATDKYPTLNSFGYDNRARVKAFVLLLRYSGLRISDVCKLEFSRFKDGKILLYTQKTGTPVYIPLPEIVIKAVKGIVNGRYLFWSGKSELGTVKSHWQRALRRLFKIAGVKGHAHMFRDTFSISLLQKGVPIEDVSILLGHANILVTQKHYSPWIASRQTRLESMVSKAWD